MQLARAAGVNYQTFACRTQARRHARGVYAQAAPKALGSAKPLRWMEAVVAKPASALAPEAPPGHQVLEVLLPGGAKLLIATRRRWRLRFKCGTMGLGLTDTTRQTSSSAFALRSSLSQSPTSSPSSRMISAAAICIAADIPTHARPRLTHSRRTAHASLNTTPPVPPAAPHALGRRCALPLDRALARSHARRLGGPAVRVKWH